MADPVCTAIVMANTAAKAKMAPAIKARIKTSRVAICKFGFTRIYHFFLQTPQEQDMPCCRPLFQYTDLFFKKKTPKINEDLRRRCLECLEQVMVNGVVAMYIESRSKSYAINNY